MKKMFKVFYLAVLGILSFLPITIMARVILELNKVIDSLGGNQSSTQTMTLSFDQMTIYQTLAAIIIFVLVIYFIIYILNDRSIYLGWLWIISFIIPGINIISIPGFWFVLIKKEIKVKNNKVIAGLNDNNPPMEFTEL